MNQQQKIIIEAFGLTSVNVGVNIAPGVIGNSVERNVYNGTVPQPKLQDKPYGNTSSLGTPIFAPLIIDGGSYNTIVNGQTTTVKYDRMVLENALITLTQAHNVVLTTIQGRDNEVIEYIGKMSMRINIKGGLFGTNNNRPIAAISNLINMLNSNQYLKIVAPSGDGHGILTEWGISQIVVLDKSIPEIAGGYNYQLFEFNAIQDVPVILATTGS